MLKRLSVKNYALINELEVNFSTGLHIITGETGAGKSVLLGALGLILGERSDSRAVQNEKCVVEAEFDLSQRAITDFFKENDLDFDVNTIIRREISSQGKSRAFVNDTPINLNALKDLGEMLVDIHSQHETLSLKDKQYQLELLDTFAGNDALLVEYKHAYRKHKGAKNILDKLLEEEQNMKSEYDYRLFQLNELRTAALRDGEQEELETELQTLEHAEEIRQTGAEGSHVLKNRESAIIEELTFLARKLQQSTSVDPRFLDLYERVNSSKIELEDVARELENIAENTNGDEQRLQWVNDRISLLFNLLKKHKAEDVAELLKLQENLEDATRRAESFDEEIRLAEKSVKAAESEVKTVAEKLSDKRKKAVEPLEEKLSGMLKDLGMPNARVKIKLEGYELFGEYGNEGAELLFSSNAGNVPLPVNKIASGGELARLMLCIKSLLAENKSLPTLIFDEIDTGISGETAQKTGKMMKRLALGHQVISVTHLPQIAGAGEHHYFVYKEVNNGSTLTKMRKLDRTERINEIARMLSGENPSDSAMENARELMGISQ